MTEKLNPEFLRGTLDLMVLSILAEGPTYGYLLQQRLRESSREMIDPAAGTLYPLLHRLEEDRLVRCRWEDSTGRRRKWYEITAMGRKRLQHRARQWQEVADCLRVLLAPVTSPKTTG